jgi:hypothetical protein
MRLNDPQAAKYALLVMYAEDMYDALPDNNRSSLTPPIDPRIQADWTIVGFISAVDALADAQRIGKAPGFFMVFSRVPTWTIRSMWPRYAARKIRVNGSRT